MPELNARPHISLAVFDEISVDLLQPMLAEIAEMAAPVRTRFASASAFPTKEGVVFFAPVVTRELLDVHAAFHRRLDEAGIVSQTYYRPGAWLPHCTVAIDLSPEQMTPAMEACLKMVPYPEVRFAGVSVVEFRPVRVIAAVKIRVGVRCEP